MRKINKLTAAPVLTVLRDHHGFIRTIALSVIVTFTLMILQPFGVAVRTAMAAEPDPLVHSDEKQLSITLQSITEKLAALEAELVAGKDGSIILAELQQLRTQVSTLDQTVTANLNDIETMLVQKNLPEVIKQRHTDMVTTYRTGLDAVLNNLDAIAAAATADEKLQKVGLAKGHLESKKHTRHQQPFDPNSLPNQHRKKDPENKPKNTPAEYWLSGHITQPLAKLAALGDFSFNLLPGASEPAYLAESTEVTLTQAIHDKAAVLNHDPVQIYNWVRNNIEWQPSWGAVQSAELTLGSQRGNAMDIASLTIALLRASGIPARYVHGTIDVPEDKFRNWAGGFSSIDGAADFAASGGIPGTLMTSNGVVAKIRMEHIWVEAAVDFNPSRGAINKVADNWVQMDPSYKQYDYLTGLDPIAISGLDTDALGQSFINSGTVNEAEGWVSGFDPTILQNAQVEVQTALETWITNNMTNPTVGDVIGGRKTIIKEYPVLLTGLPYPVVAEGARYGALPNNLQQRITFSFVNDLLGYAQNPLTLPWAQLNNQRVTLSFKPATANDEAALQALLPDGNITDISQLPTSIPSYLVNVIPELKLNGEVIKSGDPMALGAELRFGFDTRFAGGNTIPKSYNVIAGSFLSIAVIAGNISPTKLNEVQARLTDTRTKLESADPTLINTLTREEILGDMFYAGTLGYYAQYIALSHIAGLQQKAHHYLAAGLGSMGYEPTVSYFFGFPRSIEPGGVVLNIPMISVSGTDMADAEAKKNFLLQIGILSSALEHAVPEQMFTDPNDPTNAPEAISAVKALSKAQAAGQRIYHITSANQATVLPNINHDSLTMGEIQAALAVGKEVITHTDAVSVPGWTGAGYIIFDPVVGDGAYKISGGVNGGMLSLLHGMAVGMSIIAMTTLAILGGITGLLVVMNLLIPFLIGLAYGYLLFVVDAGGSPECWGTGVGVGASFAALIAAFPTTATLRATQNFISLLLGEALINGINNTYSAVYNCLKR